MNLLSAPLNKNLVIKDDCYRIDELKYHIGKNSIICVVKKLKKTGVIIGYKNNRIAVDSECAKNVKVDVI